jgi:hypothetical protein
LAVRTFVAVDAEPEPELDGAGMFGPPGWMLLPVPAEGVVDAGTGTTTDGEVEGVPETELEPPAFTAEPEAHAVALPRATAPSTASAAAVRAVVRVVVL